MSINYMVKPGTTVCFNDDCVRKPGTAHDTSVKSGLMLQPSTGTYPNGYDVADANYGDANDAESSINQCDIKARHPQTTTPYDANSQAYAAGDPINRVEHVPGKVYWLPCASQSIAANKILILTAAGLVTPGSNHTITPQKKHQWRCVKATTTQTWVLAEYLGHLMYLTAKS